MKRKALITATAVLLVAVMCLATASYAWFTAGNKTSIETFNLKVTSGDSAITLAPAQFSNGSYQDAAASDWTSNLKVDALTSKGSLIPEDALTALSTVGKWTDGKYQMFGSNYDTAKEEWTSYEVVDTDQIVENYVAISFYAKAPSNQPATFNINIEGDDAESFRDVVKVGYYTSANKTPGDFKVYNLDNELAYAGVKAAGAVSVHTGEEGAKTFEPKAGSEGNFADKVEGAYVANDAWAGQAVELTSTPQLFVVYMWVEGMDDNCTGTYALDDISVAISFDIAS